MEVLPKFPEIQKIAEPRAPGVEQAVAWWWWAGAILLGLILVAVVAGMVWGAARRAAVPATPGRPEKLALREIKHLRRRAAAMEPVAVATSLAEILRTFLHRRMGLLARYATTPEILGHTRRRHEAPPPPLVAVFQRVLQDCDALKFGASASIETERLLTEAESALHAVTAALRTPTSSAAPPRGPALPDAPAA